MMLTPGIQHTTTPEMDVITWSNKDIPKSKTYLLIWLLSYLLSCAMSTFLTYGLFVLGIRTEGSFIETAFLLFFFVFSWITIIVLPIVFFKGLQSSEKITISNTEIIVSRYDRHDCRFEKDQVLGLWYGKFRIEDGDINLLRSLIIIRKSKVGGIYNQHREMWGGYWMRTTEKYQLFLLMQQILQQRGWDIEYKEN